MNGLSVALDLWKEILDEIRRGHSSGRGQTARLRIDDKTARVGTQASFRIPHNVTVSFGVVSPDGTAFPEAVITWSVENKAVIRRRITVGNGASITGVADSVDVSIFNNAPPGEFPLPVVVDYGVSVDIAPGTRGAHIQPPILMLRDAAGSILDSVPAAASVEYLIPPDSGAIAVNVTVETNVPGTVLAGNCSIEQRRGAIPLKRYDAVLFPGWIPLAPGADRIRFTNHSVASATFGAVAGIDG